MSKFAETVKEWYREGRWTLAQVQAAKKKKKITAAEYEEIVNGE